MEKTASISHNGSVNGTMTLAERVAKLTAKKMPSTLTNAVNESTQTIVTETLKEAGDKATQNIAKKVKLWNTDNDFVKTEKKETEKAADKKDNKEEEEPVSETDKKASAETATSLLDFALVTIFTPIEKYKFKKKFLKEEWPRVKSLQYADKTKLSADDLVLLNKITKELAKFTARKDEIELNPDEARKHERAFYAYFEATNTKLSPGWILWSSLAATIGGRVTDALFED